MQDKVNSLRNRLLQQASKSARGLWNMAPILLGTIMLVSLCTKSIPRAYYSKLFTDNPFLDPVIGSALGGVSAGNPMLSYIISGELFKEGVGLLAITAFIVSWVTVAVVQLPAEALGLGKGFALVRNGLSLLFSILTAIITVFLATTMGWA